MTASTKTRVSVTRDDVTQANVWWADLADTRRVQVFQWVSSHRVLTTPHPDQMALDVDVQPCTPEEAARAADNWWDSVNGERRVQVHRWVSHHAVEKPDEADFTLTIDEVIGAAL